MSKQHPAGYTVVFDGGCGFCTRCAGWLRKLDRHRRLNIRAWQEPGVLATVGISRAQAQAAVWVRHRGRVASGAAAVCIMLDAALGVRFFRGIYRLPGMRILLERCYRWVAAHRQLFPGTTPFCADPGNCQPEET